MTDQYLYAIIDEQGSCRVIVDGGLEKVAGLPSLMREGWKPIRETPFYTKRNVFVYILICLEHA